MATVQQAEQQALQAGADPSTLAWAKSQLGSGDYKGYCERFVEHAQGTGGQYPSAIAAWNAAQQQTNLSNIQPGDVIYFGADPSNQYYGHTGVYAGNNQFVNPTYSGVKLSDINDWLKSTGQNLLGYVDLTKEGLEEWFNNAQQTITGTLKQLISGTPHAQAAEGTTETPTTPPPSFTGYVGNTPYLGGQVQTSGGGFFVDDTGKIQYSTGYHGQGTPTLPEAPPSDFTGWWKQPIQGAQYKPYVKGTVQTTGGGFTPTGDYSAGYHGSGANPQITGETAPGIYKRTFYGGMMRDPFGSLLSPNVSNTARAGDVLAYLREFLGYKTSANGVDWNAPENREKIVEAYKKGGDKFDIIPLLRTLDEGKYNPKTEILAQLAGYPNMPTSQMFGLVGGTNYSNLGANVPKQAGSTAYEPGANIYRTGTPYAWTPQGAFAPGQSYGFNPTSPYQGWNGTNVNIPPTVTPEEERQSALAQATSTYQATQLPATTTKKSEGVKPVSMASLLGTSGSYPGIVGTYNPEDEIIKSIPVIQSNPLM